MRTVPYFALALVGFAVAACATPQERVASQENLLSAAGFEARPANTPERQAALRSLPPNRFVQQPHGDHYAYVYSDPLVCNCLYLGDQQAYGRYQQDVLQRRIADEQATTAELYSDSWNWGPWGPGW